MTKIREFYGFIISKPLPLMVCLAIIEQLPSSATKELIIIDTFFDAEKLSSKLIEFKEKWGSVVFLKNHAEAFKYCRERKYSKVFIDSDVGFQKNIDLIRLKSSNPKMTLSVYEEGLGAYRNDLYRGVKKIILRLLGCSIYFGDNWLTKEIYLFDPDDYNHNVPHKKVKAIKINTTLSQLIKKYQLEFDYLFEVENLRLKLSRILLQKKCTIYLSAWFWDEKLINNVKTDDTYRIVKFHPHIRQPPKTLDFNLSVPPGVPAEILLSMASQVFANVCVLHHGSSVERYIKQGNIVYKNI